MLFSVEQAFVGKDEKRAPLKTPAWEAKGYLELIVSPTMPSASVEDRLHVLNIRYFEAATLSYLYMFPLHFCELPFQAGMLLYNFTLAFEQF